MIDKDKQVVLWIPVVGPLLPLLLLLTLLLVVFIMYAQFGVVAYSKPNYVHVKSKLIIGFFPIPVCPKVLINSIVFFMSWNCWISLSAQKPPWHWERDGDRCRIPPRKWNYALCQPRRAIFRQLVTGECLHVAQKAGPTLRGCFSDVVSAEKVGDKPNQIITAPLHPIPAIGELFERVIVGCVDLQLAQTIMCVMIQLNYWKYREMSVTLTLKPHFQRFRSL